MNSLWLETCLGSFYVAVSTSVAGCVQSVNSVFDANPRNANKLISTSVSDLLSKSNLTSDAIDQVYLSKGPGSFTGIKLSAAFALGFSFAHPKKIPILAFDGLQCLSKLSSQALLLKSTSKTGFYSDGYATKNISDSEVAALKNFSFWNAWAGVSDQPDRLVIATETKHKTLDNLVHYIHENPDLTKSFQQANYLKEPEIHSKGKK